MYFGNINKTAADMLLPEHGHSLPPGVCTFSTASPNANSAAGSLLVAEFDGMVAGDSSSSTVVGVVWPGDYEDADLLIEVACHVVGAPVFVATGTPLDSVRVPRIIAREDQNKFTSVDVKDSLLDLDYPKAVDEAKDNTAMYEADAALAKNSEDSTAEGDMVKRTYSDVSCSDGTSELVDVTKQQYSKNTLSSVVVIDISLSRFEDITAEDTSSSGANTTAYTKETLCSTVPQVNIFIKKEDCGDYDQQKYAVGSKKYKTAVAHDNGGGDLDRGAQSGMIASYHGAQQVYSSSNSLNSSTCGWQSMSTADSTCLSAFSAEFPFVTQQSHLAMSDTMMSYNYEEDDVLGVVPLVDRSTYQQCSSVGSMALGDHPMHMSHRMPDNLKSQLLPLPLPLSGDAYLPEATEVDVPVFIPYSTHTQSQKSEISVLPPPCATLVQYPRIELSAEAPVFKPPAQMSADAAEFVP